MAHPVPVVHDALTDRFNRVRLELERPNVQLVLKYPKALVPRWTWRYYECISSLVDSGVIVVVPAVIIGDECYNLLEAASFPYSSAPTHGGNIEDWRVAQEVAPLRCGFWCHLKTHATLDKQLHLFFEPASPDATSLKQFAEDVGFVIEQVLLHRCADLRGPQRVSVEPLQLMSDMEKLVTRHLTRPSGQSVLSIKAGLTERIPKPVQGEVSPDHDKVWETLFHIALPALLHSA